MSSHLITDASYIADQSRRMGVDTSQYWLERLRIDQQHGRSVCLVYNAGQARDAAARLGGRYSNGRIVFLDGAGDGCEQEIAPAVKVYIITPDMWEMMVEITNRLGIRRP